MISNENETVIIVPQGVIDADTAWVLVNFKNTSLSELFNYTVMAN